MQIFIATDGTLDTERTAEVVARLYEEGDEVTIVTAIQFPREFLRGVARTTGVDDVATFAHEAGAGVLGIAGGAKAAERLNALMKGGNAAEHPLGDYFVQTAKDRTDGLRRRLKDAGVSSVTAWASTENQTARTILDIAKRCEADILLIGAKGVGRFEGPLGSTVTKVVRRADIPVIVVK